VSQLHAYEVDPVFGCWNWTGKLDTRDGRPLVWLGRRPSSAQRLMYESRVGPIPPDHDLDHLCSNKLCVRPAHAEPVTHRENMLRKSHRYRLRIKQCKKGHDMSINAMTTPNGGRPCRTCSRSDEP
jgi:hypothetical protein